MNPLPFVLLIQLNVIGYLLRFNCGLGLANIFFHSREAFNESTESFRFFLRVSQ